MQVGVGKYQPQNYNYPSLASSHTAKVPLKIDFHFEIRYNQTAADFLLTVKKQSEGKNKQQLQGYHL